MTGWKRILVVLLILSLLTGCAVRGRTGSDAAEQDTHGVDETAAENASAPDPAEILAESTLERMTLAEKVGQLFFVRPDALDPDQPLAYVENSRAPGVQTLTEPVKNRMERIPVGGVVIFGKNIDSPPQLAALLGDMQQVSPIPLIFAVDEEGGAVSRLGSHPAFDLPRFPSAIVIGAKGDPEAARKMGRTIGEYLAMYGFAMDFAPVADVRTNPSNFVIGDRAFSSEAPVVSAMAGAMAEGLLSRGIIPVYKHFPGHGDTAEDSHLGLAILNKSEQELWEGEWLPYRENDMTDCAVMVGHIAVPTLTGDMTPASLSETMVSGFLRQKLGFDGLVITDALSMGGITAAYAPGTAAVLALKAGCDVLLMPGDLEAAYTAVLEAVQGGELAEGHIDESVRRILYYKARIGVLR